jgi:CRISPR-associated protein Csx17
MSTKHTLTLSGCAPIPLAHYLKALGILRLVSEQKDSSATGRWHRDQFILESTLDRTALLKFFLEEYQPTPVLSPWNGDGGFYAGSRPGSRKTLETIEKSQAHRLQPYRFVITQIRRLLSNYGITEKPTDDQKDTLILACRSYLPDALLTWIDSASVLTAEGAKYPPLLGTGGNDGSSDFSKNFMILFPLIFDLTSGKASPTAEAYLKSSLFRETLAVPGIDAPIGQFFPGSAGGANVTSGFKGDPIVNPWDFILMIEGALLFAAASVKRLESNDSGALAYPFCVRQAGVGYASASGADEPASRAEMWLPVWTKRPVTLPELSAIFAEGRAQVGGRAARNGVDFARAVVSMGVDRGLDEFQRYGFQVRNGLSYFATPLTRITAKKNAGADLLSDVDAWLDHYRHAATKDTAPASVRRALSNLESSIFDLCINHTTERLLAVFIALGQCQKAASKSLKWAKENYLPPLFGLRKEWLKHAWGQSLEFRLAASLASLNGKFGNEFLPLRCHLEPVDTYLEKGSGKQAFRWADLVTNHVQWSEAALPDVLNDILARRLILNEDTEKRDEIWASLADIKAFIEGETNDDLLSDLLWSMSLINWRDKQTELPSSPRARQPVPPTFYAMLRLCFPPVQKPQPHGILSVPIVPAIHRQAALGNGGQAAVMALRRLRASGYSPAIRQLPIQGDYAKRTAAALLFPISPQTLEAILNQTTRPEKNSEPVITKL